MKKRKLRVLMESSFAAAAAAIPNNERTTTLPLFWLLLLELKLEPKKRIDDVVVELHIAPTLMIYNRRQRRL